MDGNLREMVDTEVVGYEKEASVRPNGVGELRIRERYNRYDRFCFKHGPSLTSFTNHRENWVYVVLRYERN
jgi:hypothetical protein